MLPGLALMGAFAQGGAAGSFWASVSDDSVSKTSSTTGGPKVVTTSPVTVTPHGGSGSPTYSWVRLSGSTGIAATASSSATTAFTGTLNPDDYFAAIFQCTVTDGSGATTTLLVNVTLELVSFA